ncbi:MAG TPA: hypothetical protein VFP12_09880 [Allosphingosinicella sp.]|nr:hypothetical protein [Allosphingosinicella sp.]
MAHRKTQAGKWRKRFLSAMARTANAGLSAEMAGVDRTTAFALRQRDPAFAAAWMRARDWGRARAEAEGQPVFPGGRPRAAGPAPDPRPLKGRRRRDGGTEIVRCGEGRMSPESDQVFLTHLAAGFGVRRSAAAAGFSTTALYARRMLDPAFAAQWEAAKAQLLARNDMLLIDSLPRTLDPEVTEAADDLAKPTIAEAIRIQRLYLAAARRGPGRVADEPAPAPSAEEIFDELHQRLQEIKRDAAAEKLASGWVQDEDGNWIPPGWVRKGEAA